MMLYDIPLCLYTKCALILLLTVPNLRYTKFQRRLLKGAWVLLQNK